MALVGHRPGPDGGTLGVPAGHLELTYSARLVLAHILACVEAGVEEGSGVGATPPLWSR